MSPLELPPEDRSWLACAIDTEGSICQRDGKGGFVAVYNTNKDFVDRFSMLSGAPVYRKPNNGLKPGGMIWEIRTAKREIVQPLLTAVLPYLIIKKGKAEKLLRYYHERQAEIDRVSEWRRKKVERLSDVQPIENILGPCATRGMIRATFPNMPERPGRNGPQSSDTKRKISSSISAYWASLSSEQKSERLSKMVSNGFRGRA